MSFGRINGFVTGCFRGPAFGVILGAIIAGRASAEICGGGEWPLAPDKDQTLARTGAVVLQSLYQLKIPDGGIDFGLDHHATFEGGGDVVPARIESVSRGPLNGYPRLAIFRARHLLKEGLSYKLVLHDVPTIDQALWKKYRAWQKANPRPKTLEKDAEYNSIWHDAPHSYGPWTVARAKHSKLEWTRAPRLVRTNAGECSRVSCVDSWSPAYWFSTPMEGGRGWVAVRVEVRTDAADPVATLILPVQPDRTASVWGGCDGQMWVKAGVTYSARFTAIDESGQEVAAPGPPVTFVGFER
jgi:hypothetical protein